MRNTLLLLLVLLILTFYFVFHHHKECEEEHNCIEAFVPKSVFLTSATHHFKSKPFDPRTKTTIEVENQINSFQLKDFESKRVLAIASIQSPYTRTKTHQHTTSPFLCRPPTSVVLATFLLSGIFLNPSALNTLIRIVILSVLLLHPVDTNSTTVTTELVRNHISLNYVLDQRSYRELPVLYVRIDEHLRARPVTYRRRHNEYFTPLEFESRPPLSSYGNSNTTQIHFNPISRWEYSARKTFTESVNVYVRMIPGLRHEDLDDVFEFLFSHPLHVFMFLQCIGFVQMFLSALAFKNDIAFFRGRDSYDGLSYSSVATSCLQSWVIFLYLFEDTNHMTSRILLLQLFVGCCISTWKAIRIRQSVLSFRFIVVPWMSSSSSSSSSSTRSIDQEGMRALLCYVLIPLMIVWSFRSWYTYDFTSGRYTVWNFVLSSAADFSYLFGFLNMTPQLFLNYKLKSVAAMPWRVMTYKFFNTIIDDIFAFFIVQITSKHRWMTLRDDFVFLIFLYQRWLYQDDVDRPDEYGFVYSKELAKKKKKKKLKGD